MNNQNQQPQSSTSVAAEIELEIQREIEQEQEDQSLYTQIQDDQELRDNEANVRKARRQYSKLIKRYVGKESL